MTTAGDHVLLDAVSANGAGDPASWTGGNGLYSVTGSFGGGTCTLEYSLDGTTFQSVGSDGALTAAGGVGFWLPPCAIRANLTGATGPSLTAIVRPG